MEPTINIELTASEVQALGALIDAAVKATGMQGAKAAMPIYAKLEAAVATANNSVAKEEPGA